MVRPTLEEIEGALVISGDGKAIVVTGNPTAQQITGMIAFEYEVYVTENANFGDEVMAVLEGYGNIQRVKKILVKKADYLRFE